MALHRVPRAAVATQGLVTPPSAAALVGWLENSPPALPFKSTRQSPSRVSRVRPPPHLMNLSWVAERAAANASLEARAGGSKWVAGENTEARWEGRVPGRVGFRVLLLFITITTGGAAAEAVAPSVRLLLLLLLLLLL